MEIQADGCTLVLSGDFDVRSTWEVRTAIYEQLSMHESDIVLDLRDVEAIDVTALKVLAVASRYAVAHGRRLTLRGCRPAVRRMMLISRLNRMVQVEHESVPA